MASTAYSQTGGYNTPYSEGPGVVVGATEPALRKWYVPQELYAAYGWEQWRYSNYARTPYERYTDILREGERWYDIYGNYVGRGWRVYDVTLEQPRDFGSSIFKDPRFKGWFNNLIISRAQRGQYFTALTVGDEIRTTLTPLTFSTPTFNGVQLDFQSDKYSATLLTSRINNPGSARDRDKAPPETATDLVNLVGLRGVAQLGDFAQVGGTYVNAAITSSLDDWAENSLKGKLSSGQNSGKVRTLTVRLSDDSPGDGVAGAMLFAERILIDGRRANVIPTIKGGTTVSGRREANGSEQIYLVYDITGWSYMDEKGKPRDVNWFERVSFELVLANDYRIEATSNLQVDRNGQEIFLPVKSAPGNVKDATNQRVVRFDYGLPTANEIMGVTLDLTDIAGFWLRGELDVNRRHRRFPNANRDILEHRLSTDRSTAFYTAAQRLFYPWFAYGEVFSMAPDYTTSMYLVDGNGRVFYDDKGQYLFEFVDDNDNQDRYPDWDRNSANQRAGSNKERGDGIFPGLDENNDFVSDFNQNQNFQPDYEEPFLRHNVDPPEYLFGMDMNNNTVVDRFENDDEADYPYKRDHRGYNSYVGAEVLRGLKISVGHLDLHLLSSKRSSRATYLLVTGEKKLPGIGTWRAFGNLKTVKDDIPDNLLLWQQLPNTLGAMVDFTDPLVAMNTNIGTFYSDFSYTGVDNLTLINKIKYETHRQRERRPKLNNSDYFLGLINKAGYTWNPVIDVVTKVRLKSMFRAERPALKSSPGRRELYEIASLSASRPVLASGIFEAGLEYGQFINLIERPAVTPYGYVDDFESLVFALQYSNSADYLGYRLTSKVGFRQQTRYFSDTLRTSSIIFVQIFAGVGEE